MRKNSWLICQHCDQSNFIQKYIMSTKTKFNLFNVIISSILTPFLTLLSQPILPSPLRLQNFKTPNESLMSVCCMCVDLASLSHT